MLPVPGFLVAQVHTLVESDVMKDPSFSKQRADALDAHCVSLIADMLPGSKAYHPLYYRLEPQGDRYEMDGLILYAKWAIVVEGKAAQLSVPARRGDLERLRRDIRRSVGEAREQARRDIDYLERDEVITFQDAGGKTVLTLSGGRFEGVFAVNPTLHSFGIAPVHSRGLEDLGLLTPEPACWTVFINDLHVVCEMLSHPIYLVHYLKWRRSVPLGDRVVTHDELDLLGAYMFGGLWELEEVEEDVMLHLANSTSDFDSYYMPEAAVDGGKGRPEKIVPEGVRRFLAGAGPGRSPTWWNSALALLDIPFRESPVIDVVLAEAEEVLRTDRVHGRRLGRTAVVAARRGIRWADARTQAADVVAGSTFRVFAQMVRGEPRIVRAWVVGSGHT